jgi:hypothetical protein
MKKMIPFVLLFSMAALPVSAASTCETRVDNHQDASTTERVAYCLSDDETVTSTEKPELIYSDIYANPPQTDEKITPTKNKNPYYNPKRKSVAQEYVSSEKFPAFKNGTMSEQERIELEQKVALAKQLADNYHATGQKPARTDSVKQVLVQTQSGLQKRQTKPRRFMKEVVIQQEEVLTETSPAAETMSETTETTVSEPAADVPDTQDFSYGAQSQQDLESLPPADASPYSSLDDAVLPIENN